MVRDLSGNSVHGKRTSQRTPLPYTFYTAVMLWVMFTFIVLSALGIAWLTFGPLKGTPQVTVLRIIAAVQLLAAFALAGARLSGAA